MEKLASPEQLKQIIARIETKNEEKTAILADIREIYNEAKITGFDKKAIREIVKLRKKDRDEREQEDEILTLYRSALEI